MEIFSVKLEKKVGNFLPEVAQLVELAEQHFVGGNHLSPPQGTPTDAAWSTTKQLVGDITSPLCTGPDIAADAEAAAPGIGQGCNLGRSIRLLCEKTLPDLNSRTLSN